MFETKVLGYKEALDNDLETKFKGHLKVNKFFSNETPTSNTKNFNKWSTFHSTMYPLYGTK